MALVTVFWPLKITGADRLLCHTTGAPRLLATSKVKPLQLAGQVKTTLEPEGRIANGGALTGITERLNTVPLPADPP